MDEIEIYDDFLKSLRVAITNSSVYFNKHPIFVKSIEDFGEKLEKVFPLLNPLKFGITPTSLLFSDKVLEGTRLYSDVAEFFHRRKIKSIEIKPGVTGKELVSFLALMNLSAKNILENGGPQNILKQRNVSHIVAEELDYSQLLKGEGQELKDIWFYMLKKSFGKQGGVPIEELADGFSKVLTELKVEDLLIDGEDGPAINKFLVYLKDKDKNKFLKCAKGLTKLVARSGDLSKKDIRQKLGTFFQSIETDDFSQMLLDEFEKGDEINSLSIKLFSKLLDRNEHEKVASSLADKIKKKDWLRNNPKLLEGIKDLISLPEAPYIAQIYKHNLSELLENVSLNQGMSFDRNQLENNYQLTLLDLFILETDTFQLELIIDNIMRECEKRIELNSFKYLKSVAQALEKKRKDNPSLGDIFTKVEKGISQFIESAVLAQKSISDFEYFLNILKISTLDSQAYISEIFNENKLSFYSLSLFFKFFKEDLNIFCENLDKKITDALFLKKLIESLQKIDSFESLEVLKHIFYSSNDFIKIEILKLMLGLSVYDEKFLFSILKNLDFMQRKLAFIILIKRSQLKNQIAQALLAIRNPFGLHSRLIQENLKIVAEEPFKGLENSLLLLTKYRFFWNRIIRQTAKEILDKLNG
ncbi:MAG: hypothetical protein NG737_02750 [Omnitrophica bacterium]|nr:hypothetical protein [Candidatus Omnitrophota bacterium]